MANKDYKRTGSGDFAPIAELALPISYFDTQVSLKNYNLPSEDALEDVDNLMMLIDEEFIAVDSVHPGGAVIRRGCFDTVPAEHPVDSICWFILSENGVGSDGVEHVGGDEVAVKVTPQTVGGGAFPIESAPPKDLEMNWRFFRPYAPGQMLVRGLPWFTGLTLSADESELLLKWDDRDRVLQADRLIDHFAGNIGPEPGTTYTARVYDFNMNLKRTEVGIIGNLTPEASTNTWPYTWQQAMNDLEYPGTGALVTAYIRFCSARDGFDSWQDYTIRFEVDTTGSFLRVASFAEMVAQPTDQTTEDDGPTNAIYSPQMAKMVAQPTTAEDDAPVAAEGMYVASMQQPAGQLTSFYTPINRNLFEAPYNYLVRRSQQPVSNRLVTVAARPSDRLTDSHGVFSRENYPIGSGAAHPFDLADEPAFTPWITTRFKLQHLETTVPIKTSSFYDGVPLTSVQVGMMALIGAEIVRIVEVREFEIEIARGCSDTIPAVHVAASRMWFFEAASGNDPREYIWITLAGESGAAAEVKIIPAVYGPPLLPKDVPTDKLNFALRTERPLPPGRVVANGRPWFEGARVLFEEDTVITWAHRNRITQAAEVIDHTNPDIEPEANQKYRLAMYVWLPNEDGPPTRVTIRSTIVDGNSFVYTYAQARADGNRAGRLLGACGSVSVAMILTTVRMGSDAMGKEIVLFEAWQSYSIYISLPSYVCPPNQPPGGGQTPPTGGDSDAPLPGGGTPGLPPGGGNGDPGGDIPGDGDIGGQDPIDNGEGENGGGPPKPPDPPPDWPDPIEPPPDPVPDDPNPDLAAHWDTNWDRHWDARFGDDTGGEN